MGKDERRKHQKGCEERVGYNGGWMVEIIMSSFKRLLGGALRAVKPEYTMIEVATMIAAYHEIRTVMGRPYGEQGLTHAPPGRLGYCPARS